MGTYSIRDIYLANVGRISYVCDVEYVNEKYYFTQNSVEIFSHCQNKVYIILKIFFISVNTGSSFYNFYSASALLAMQSAVLARGILSVCPSVTFRYCVQTNEDTIVRFSASGKTIPLVSGEVKFIRIFARDHPQRGR